MKKTHLRLILLILISAGVVLSACKDDNQTLFSSRITNDRGSLKVLNSSSYLGSTVPGTSFDETITVFASGGLTLTNFSATLTTSAPITWAGGTYPGTGGTCSTELESGQSCTVVLRYEPTVVASHSATLDFFFTDALGDATLSYIIYADSSPILQFEYGSTYDFGNRFLGTSTDLRIRVSNVGKVPAENISINNLTAPFSYKGGSYPGTGGNCGTRIPVGTSCTIYITYAPASRGQHSQDITFSYTNTSRPESNTLSLLAWGFEEALLQLSESSGVSYGNIAAGHNHDRDITVTYVSGDVAATSMAISGLSSPFAQVSGGTCSTSLSKSTGSCTIRLRASSTSSGASSQTLTFTYNTGLQARTITRTVQANVQQKAVLSLSPTGNVDFGLTARNTTKDQTFTVAHSSGEMEASLTGFGGLTAPFGYIGGTFPGGGTCGAKLNPGESCTVRLRFSPTNYGSPTLNSTFTYNDGQASTSLPVVALRGQTESQLSLSPAASFGEVVIGLTKTLEFTLSASAGATSSFTSAPSLSGPFSYAGTGNYPGTGGTCGTSTFVSNSTCKIRITFAPTSVGNTAPENLTINYNDGITVRQLTASLSGTGRNPAELSLSTTNFGTVDVNSELVRNVTLTNTSNMTASNIQTPTITPTTGFSIVSSTCGASGSSLSGNGSCQITIKFSPTAAVSYNSQIEISYFDGATNRTTSANISGAGQLTNNLYISEIDPYNFGQVYRGDERTKVITIRHGGGTTPATINSKSISLASDYSIPSSTDGCATSTSLVNGETCTLTVRFNPSIDGTRNSTLTLNYSNGSVLTTTRSFTGTALTPREISYSVSGTTITNHDFGSRPTDQTYDQTITIRSSGANTGTGTQRIDGSAFSYVGGSFPGTSGTCTTAFNDGCTIRVRFTPAAVTNYTGKVTITYNNGYNSSTTAILNLAGSGIATSVLSFASATTAFGTTIQSKTVERTITVNHSGPIPATNLNATALSAPYGFKGASFPGTGGTCTTTLNSGSCTMVIEFTPTTVGAQNSNLNLSYNNGTSTRSISNSLTGTAVSQAILTRTPSAPYNFGTTSVGSEVDRTITIYNAGGTSAAAVGATFDNAVFSFKNGSFPGTGGTCTTTITANQTCTIVIQFKPSSTSAFSGIMTFTYNDGLRTQTELLDVRGN